MGQQAAVVGEDSCPSWGLVVARVAKEVVVGVGRSWHYMEAAGLDWLVGEMGNWGYR